MSRGPGMVMRRALEIVRRTGQPLTSQEVARQVFGLANTADLSAAQSASVRRALRALARGGEVEDMGRGWARKCRKWATPEAAKSHREWARGFMEASRARAQAREDARRAALEDRQSEEASGG